MKASEAKALAKKNLTGVVISPMLEAIFAEVKAASERGRFSMMLDWGKIKPYPSSLEKESVEGELYRLGYRIVHHPDPDPEHPCSHPWDELIWS